MKRFSFDRVLNFAFRDTRFHFAAQIAITDDEPEIQPMKISKAPAAAPVESMGDYESFHSSRHFVIKTKQGMRIEIDPYQRIVQVDGKVGWVSTNFGGLEYGWTPDPVNFFRSNETALEVDWTPSFSKDKFGNLLLNLSLRDKDLRIAIHADHQYVIVWDAAIRALFRAHYITIGPERPVPAVFHQMMVQKRPKVVNIDTLRSA